MSKGPSGLRVLLVGGAALAGAMWAPFKADVVKQGALDRQEAAVKASHAAGYARAQHDAAAAAAAAANPRPAGNLSWDLGSVLESFGKPDNPYTLDALLKE